ncbi:MAG: putative metal-dependent hydrolase [Saprospiraceae bacterium]|nr:putative metal-dependent hydrolase [Saprospiraceae bacterium]
MENLKYPIGRFSYNPEESDLKLQESMRVINEFPGKLETLLASMSPEQMDTPYRPEGWTARQVVHHVADSHTHALMRFKWSLTEDEPTIKAYLEAKNAQLPDYQLPVESALHILKGVHMKWKCIMENMSSADWDRGYHHPQTNRFFSLKEAAALYEWHCLHHYGHLEICKASGK